MNKKLLAVASVSLLLVLSACAPATTDEDVVVPPENDVVENNNDVVENNDNEVVEDNDEEVVESEKTDTELQEEFVRETFSSYDYDAPEYSAWEVKEEGPEKMAVIIKEEVEGQNKPNISKVIYLWNGSKETAEVLHVTVENNDVYNGN